MTAMPCKRTAAVLLVGIFGLGLSACAEQSLSTMSREDKIAWGTISGAAIGGAAGYSLIGGSNALLIGGGLGALAGGAAGYHLTERLTRYDREAIHTATYRSLTEDPVGGRTAWENPQSGNSGEISPTRTYMANDGRLCREFSSVALIDGERLESMRTACRTARGDWIVS